MAAGFARFASLTFIALLTGCAAALPNSDGGQARLNAGAAVAPPVGLLEYCARTIGECDTVLLGSLRGTLPATGAPGVSRRMPYAPGEDSAASTASVFQALLSARLRGDSAPVPGREVTLSEANWRELVALNRSVNRAIHGATDREIYGVEERWTRPLSDNPGAFGVRGDCEDYALEKRARLLAAGWPAEALAMAIAIVPDVGLHAVLIVQTSEGDFVLDNLHSRPRHISHRDYVWVSRQVGGRLDQWASAWVSDGPPLNRGGAVYEGGAEAAFQASLQAARARQAAKSPQPQPRPFVAAAPPLQLVNRLDAIS